METFESPVQAMAALEVLPGFDPIHRLWDCEPSAFPSENSARWAIRQHRQALIDAGALALHMGRTFVHRERMAKVMHDQALQAYKQRHTGGAR
jgi:hypothetical protein